MDQLCFNGAPCIHANKSSHLPGTALLDEPGLTGDGRILKHAHTCSLQQQCCSFLPGRSRVWVQAEGNLRRPFSTSSPADINGTWRIFRSHYCQWGIPKAVAQFLMQTELENGRCFFLFLLINSLIWNPNLWTFFSWIDLYSWYQELYHISFWCLTLNYMWD